jgi:AraC-like DNA-binding protein
MLVNTVYMRNSSNMSDDPLSDVLKLANTQSVLTGGFTAGGAWALRFPAPDKLKFFALVKGSCWLRIDGEEPVPIEAGDVLLLCARRSFVLAGDLSAEPLDARTVFTDVVKTAKLGESEDCIQIGGHIRLDNVSGRILTDVLPPLIHVRAASAPATVLQWLLGQLIHERDGALPGSALAIAQLAQLMFVQILRVHLAISGPLPVGWLRAATDQRLAPVLRLMHDRPGHAWRLEELAVAAGMSRTTFAVHFKVVAGVTPLAYLAQWRMRLAEHALREGNTPVSVLAGMLGYSSESAFSNAFKRVMGSAPKRYRSMAWSNGLAGYSA